MKDNKTQGAIAPAASVDTADVQPAGKLSAERYFDNLHTIEVGASTRRWFVLLGKAYDLRNEFAQLVEHDPQNLPDCANDFYYYFDDVIRLLENHYVHYSILFSLPSQEDFAGTAAEPGDAEVIASEL